MKVSGSEIPAVFIQEILKREQENTKLIKAITEGKRDDFVLILKTNPEEAHKTGYNQCTALQIAAGRDKFYVEKLLENNADINITNIRDESTLHYAIISKSTNIDQKKEIIDLLIENNANIDARNRSGDTSLHWSVFGIKMGITTPEIVEFLIAKGASVNITNNAGDDPLMGSFSMQVEQNLSEQATKQNIKIFELLCKQKQFEKAQLQTEVNYLKTQVSDLQAKLALVSEQHTPSVDDENDFRVGGGTGVDYTDEF